MKAVLLTGHGGLEKLEYREDVPSPEYAEGEVLIAVGAAGINNTDIWTREGAYGTGDDPAAASGWRRGRPMRFPRIQGADIVGRIVAVGGGVNASRIGERVIVDNTLYSGGEEGLVDSGLIGSERDGGFAEYVAVPAENAHAIESDLSDAELATFPTAYVTSLRMLNRARVSAGEAVLVTGASGGVGSGLIQLARLRGARVIAVVGSGKEDQARALRASGRSPTRSPLPAGTECARARNVGPRGVGCDRLKKLAEIKVALVVGCEFCIDIGAMLGKGLGITDDQLRALPCFRESASFSPLEKLVLEYAAGMSRTPASVPDDLFGALREYFDVAQMVELTAAIAWENHRARSNQALGMGSQGFSEGSLCLLPEVPGAAR